MEEREGVIEKHWWWAIASGAQFGWGLFSYRKGYAGDSRLMPLKAFAVASLFVGATTSASISALQASGIQKVEDLMEVGANIRTGLGIRPRVPKDVQKAEAAAMGNEVEGEGKLRLTSIK